MPPTGIFDRAYIFRDDAPSGEFDHSATDMQCYSKSTQAIYRSQAMVLGVNYTDLCGVFGFLGVLFVDNFSTCPTSPPPPPTTTLSCTAADLVTSAFSIL